MARMVALVRDLLFATKISAEARAAGVGCAIVREVGKLAEVGETPLLLVDLNLAGAIEAAAEYGRGHPGTSVVGFVSHVDGATILAARNAGIGKVLARSAFVEQLPGLLRALES